MTEIFHFSTDTMFLARCGARTEVGRNGHALTSQANLVTCRECLRLDRAERSRVTTRAKAQRAERDRQIQQMKRAGASVHTIAERFNLADNRVYQICARKEAAT